MSINWKEKIENEGKTIQLGTRVRVFLEDEPDCVTGTIITMPDEDFPDEYKVEFDMEYVDDGIVDGIGWINKRQIEII